MRDSRQYLLERQLLSIHQNAKAINASSDDSTDHTGDNHNHNAEHDLPPGRSLGSDTYHHYGWCPEGNVGDHLYPGLLRCTNGEEAYDVACSEEPDQRRDRRLYLILTID